MKRRDTDTMFFFSLERNVDEDTGYNLILYVLYEYIFIIRVLYSVKQVFIMNTFNFTRKTNNIYKKINANSALRVCASLIIEGIKILTLLLTWNLYYFLSENDQ